MIDVEEFAVLASWIASAAGLALAVWSWFGARDAIRKVRFLDTGVVLLFSSILLRIVAQEKPMGMLDWAMVFLGPLFIAAALWRLARTACPPGDRS